MLKPVKRCTQKRLAIMLTVFAFSLAVTLIDAFIHPNYFVKIPTYFGFYKGLYLFAVVLAK